MIAHSNFRVAYWAGGYDALGPTMKAQKQANN